MTYNDEETKKLKTMMLFLIKKKHTESGGHCGFQLSELKVILDELEKEGEIKLRPTINSEQYFLNNQK